jgi:hypothetical protein
MNLRQEISMGLEADGCTSFAWKTEDVSLLAQNWDVSIAILFPPALFSYKPVGRTTTRKPHPPQH